MSKERALLARVLTSELWSVQEELQAEIKKLLAQPEQEPVAWVWNPARDIWERVCVFGHWQEGAIYTFGATAPEAELELKREPLRDVEIAKLWANKSPMNEFECTRLVEKAHGIGVDDE